MNPIFNQVLLEGDQYLARLNYYRAVYPSAKWVDVNYTGATANGGFSTPYKTIAAAYAGASTGGTIILKRGLYLEAAALDINGKALTFIGVGQVEWKHATDATAYLVYLRTDNCSFQNIIFNGMKTDGTTKRYSCIYFTKSGATFTGCTFRNSSDIALWCNANTGMLTLSGCTLINNDKVITSSANGLTVTNCYIDSTCGTSGSALTITGGNTVISGTISNSTAFASFVTHTSTGNLTLTGNRCKNAIANVANSTGAVIINSNVSTSSSTALVYFIQIGSTCNTSSLSIQNNSMTSSAAALGASPSAIKITNQAALTISGNIIDYTADVTQSLIWVQSNVNPTTIDISDNLLRGRHTSGYFINVGLEGTGGVDNDKIKGVIEHNYIYGWQYYNDTVASCGVHAIFVGHNIDIHVRFNNVRGAGYGCVYKHSGGVMTTGGVYANVFVNNTTGLYAKGIESLPVYNNTVLLTSSTGLGASACHGLLYSENAAGVGCDNSIQKNNIISFIGDGWTSGCYAFMGVGNAPGLISDYNCIFDNGDSRVADGFSTWADWTTAGNDANGLNTDPLLEDVSNGQYWPQTTPASPCIGAGESLADGYKDILDITSSRELLVTIDQNTLDAWFIGAYAFQTS